MKKCAGMFTLFLFMLVLNAILSQQVHATTPQKQTVYEAQADFVKVNNMKKTDIVQTMIYDVNNDNDDEILIVAWDKKMELNSKALISIYNNEGNLLVTKMFNNQSEYFLPYKLNKIKNKMFKNCLIIQSVSGASGGSDAKVFAFVNDTLKLIGTIDASETQIYIKDSDKDGNDEIHGKEWYLSPETSKLGHAHAIYDKFAYVWSAKQQKYIKYVYGQDGKRDDLRKETPPLTPANAVNLVNTANQALNKSISILTFKQYRQKMQFLFTYNLIYDSYSIGNIETKNIYIPKFHKNKVKLISEADQKRVTIFESSTTKDTKTGEIFNYIEYVVVLKTKYGWKIDSIDWEVE
ncbi:hypothetical protein ACE3MZ_16935 [Paenibacillus sp. WLX1005]|uniref:hypothetical protein n=1 Tax=Paenibacillus sp. WLX1005 TaxID=3243766 RepID=UPI003983FA91